MAQAQFQRNRSYNRGERAKERVSHINAQDRLQELIITRLSKDSALYNKGELQYKSANKKLKLKSQFDRGPV